MTQRTLEDDAHSQARHALLLVPLVIMLAGCKAPMVKTLPAEIVGRWTTGEPQYRSRSMTLEPEQITFGLGGLAPDKVEQVETVRMAQKQGEIEYLINLKAADQTPDSFVVRFRPENGGELRLRNQSKVVWTRANNSSRPVQSMELQTPIVPETRYFEHRTIYKIDCLHVDICHSY